MQLFIVDAFADEMFGGNPAGVVIIPQGEDFPKEETMIKTAAELRYSETAFVKILDENQFNIRYFTPVAEVDLCGHATIASFRALLHTGIITDGSYINHSLAGDLNIDVNNGFIYMDMAQPELIRLISNDEELNRLYRIMGLDYQSQRSKGLNLIPQIVSTGLADIMMPVESVDDLDTISPDFPQLSDLSKDYDVTGVHAFALGKDGSCHVRNFAPLFGIDEESATGTSNGALTCYFFINELLGSESDCKFVQGEKMGRPSVIISRLKADVLDKSVSDSIKAKDCSKLQLPAKIPCSIQVGGGGVIVAQGEIEL